MFFFCSHWDWNLPYLYFIPLPLELSLKGFSITLVLLDAYSLVGLLCYCMLTVGYCLCFSLLVNALAFNFLFSGKVSEFVAF